MRIHTYRPATLLSVTGDDAAAFLQGQFTNELRQPAGAAVYGLWLNQKGKVLADSQVLKLAENEFKVASTASPVTVIQPRLEQYIIADDVLLTDETAQVHGLTVVGPHSGEIIRQVCGAAPRPGQFLQTDGMLVFAGRRTRGENFEIMGPGNSLGEMKAKLLGLGGLAATAAEMESARILDGIPSVPQDLGPGDLPGEGGLEDEAISYTKGCYLGQEVMARLKNLGQVRRRLHVIQGPGRPPAEPAPLYQGEQMVGQVRSAAVQGNEFSALAMLSLVKLRPGAGLSLTPAVEPTIRILPHG
jgi:folate-binding protein YgfZ